MLSLHEPRSFTIDAGNRVDQIHRVELVPAVVALVAAGPGIVADGAGALDETVGQSASRGRGDGSHLGLGDDVTIVVQRREHFLHHPVVVRCGGTGVQVVGQAQPLQIGCDHPVVLVCAFAGRQTLRVCLHLDCGAVFVRSGDHQHVVSCHAHVARENIRGDAETGDMTDVTGTIGIGPGNRR